VTSMHNSTDRALKTYNLSDRRHCLPPVHETGLTSRRLDLAAFRLYLYRCRHDFRNESLVSRSAETG